MEGRITAEFQDSLKAALELGNRMTRENFGEVCRALGTAGVAHLALAASKLKNEELPAWVAAQDPAIRVWLGVELSLCLAKALQQCVDWDGAEVAGE